MFRMYTRLACMTLLLASVSGCGTLNALNPFAKDKPPKTSLRSLQVLALPDANHNTAVALDIVFVYRPMVADLLPKTAPEWFARKQELLGAAPTDIDVVALQVPPAFAIDAVELPKRHKKAIRVTGYANYVTKAGQHSLELTAYKKVLLRLKDMTVELSEP